MVKGPSVQPGHRLPPQCLPQLLCISYCPCCCGNIPQQCDWREKGSVLARTSRSAYQGSEVRMEEHMLEVTVQSRERWTKAGRLLLSIFSPLQSGKGYPHPHTVGVSSHQPVPLRGSPTACPEACLPGDFSLSS